MRCGSGVLSFIDEDKREVHSSTMHAAKHKARAAARAMLRKQPGATKVTIGIFCVSASNRRGHLVGDVTVRGKKRRR